METRSDGSSVDLLFVGGRLAAVRSATSPVGRQAVELLLRSELVAPAALQEAGLENGEIEDVYQRLVQSPPFPVELFIRAAGAIERDLLLEVWERETGYFEFKQRFVAIHPELSLSLSSGQVLLDLVEYEALSERYLELTGQGPKAGVTAIGTAESLSPEESAVLQGAAAPILLQRLKARTLLGQIQFCSAVVSLIDRRLLEVRVLDEPELREGGIALGPGSEADDEGEAPDGLRDLWLQFRSPETESAPAAARSARPEEPTQPRRPSEDKLAKLTEEFDDLLPLAESSEITADEDRLLTLLQSERQGADPLGRGAAEDDLKLAPLEESEPAGKSAESVSRAAARPPAPPPPAVQRELKSTAAVPPPAQASVSEPAPTVLHQSEPAEPSIRPSAARGGFGAAEMVAFVFICGIAYLAPRIFSVWFEAMKALL